MPASHAPQGATPGPLPLVRLVAGGLILLSLAIGMLTCWCLMQSIMLKLGDRAGA